MDNIKKSVNGESISFALEEDNRIYEAIITELLPTDRLPKRYEVEVPNGISINDFDQYGDNLLYAWCFPADSMNEAIIEFVKKIREEREKNK